MPELTLYYDGNCPFCLAKMRQLQTWNRAGRLGFVDIATPGFDPAFLGASMDDLNRQLYGQRAGGEVLIGVYSILAAYTLTGRGWRVLPLRVPVLRGLLSWAYRLFARHRYRISRLLGYKTAPVCSDGVCQRRTPF